MKKALTLITMLICVIPCIAQIITFDDQGYSNSQNLGNPYTIANNGETFLFTISGNTNPATQHRYVTQENSCSSSGLGHITAGTFSATTWTIETVSGNEIDLGTLRFDNVFGCFAFEYSLTIEGFKNNISTGSQAFTTSGLNSVFSSNSSFDDVDKIVITSTDLANLGIDDINWTASTLHNEAFVLEDSVRLEMSPSSHFIRIISSNLITLKNYTIYSINGVKVNSGTDIKISTASLSKGIYVLKLNFDRGVLIKKVILK